MFKFVRNGRRRASVNATASLLRMQRSPHCCGSDIDPLAKELVAAVWTTKPLRFGSVTFEHPSSFAVAIEALANGVTILADRPMIRKVVAVGLVGLFVSFRNGEFDPLSSVDHALIDTLLDHFKIDPYILSLVGR